MTRWCNNTTSLALATTAALVVIAPAIAQSSGQVAGEVRRVDISAGTVTLKHDAIAALDLPAMTLVYQAAPALLHDLKPGDKVRFTAMRQDGKYVVTAMTK